MTDEKAESLLGRAVTATKTGLANVQAASAAGSQKQAEWQEAQAQRTQAWRQHLIANGDLFEYDVIELRTSLVGDKIDGRTLALTLNRRAADGWHVKSVTRVDIKGRLGPGGTDGLLVLLERRIYS